MRNPLSKRQPRQLRQEAGKLIALFLFLTATIGFVSGFLVADGSMKTAYDRSFSKYSVEDGHFTLAQKADSALLEQLEGEGVTISKLFYRDRALSSGHSIRVYENRESVNMPCVMEGTLPVKENQIAITFTGNDMGSDRAMILALLYIIMVVLAFVFAVTTRSTIEQESAVIGTLRASGYTRGELVRHYLALPTLVTLTAAVIGNLIGYTAMKQVIASMYYRSYSLPTYTTLWNGQAFLLTTLIPCAIILLVNLVVLSVTLSLPPLQFLRHDMKWRQKTGMPNHIPSPHWIQIAEKRSQFMGSKATRTI